MIFRLIIIFGNGGWNRNVAAEMGCGGLGWNGVAELEWGQGGDWSPADVNGDKGEIGLLRTGKLLRWRRDKAERGMLWGF